MARADEGRASARQLVVTVLALSVARDDHSAMNSTERNRKMRSERKAGGLREVRGIWLLVENHQHLKDYVAWCKSWGRKDDQESPGVDIDAVHRRKP